MNLLYTSNKKIYIFLFHIFNYFTIKNKNNVVENNIAIDHTNNTDNKKE